MPYIYELPDWPHFRMDTAKLAPLLARVRHEQGRLIGRMEGLGFTLREEAVLETLTADVLKTSEIEGEHLNAAQVQSSIARHLGIETGALTPASDQVDGVVEMMLDATQNYAEPLTSSRLFRWHGRLFPTGYSALAKIGVGAWRTDAGGPMRVVSGYVGRERIHFEAPVAARVESEMAAFLDWFNCEGENDETDPVVKAGLAHLWFVTIHPFDDGNGRIARAIADMQLARSEGTSQRFYSMSAQIRTERRAYYDVLDVTEKSSLDVTRWMEWFLGCLGRAIAGAQDALASVLRRAKFWGRAAELPLNERQRAILKRLLDGFEGKLTTDKYAKLAKCSQDTAYRDILQMVDWDVLVRRGGGRNTWYEVVG